MTKRTLEDQSGQVADTDERPRRRRLVALIPGSEVLKQPKAVAVELARRCTEALAEGRPERSDSADDDRAGSFGDLTDGDVGPCHLMLGGFGHGGWLEQLARSSKLAAEAKGAPEPEAKSDDGGAA